MTLLDQISTMLGDADALGSLGAAAGTTSDESRSLLSASIPAVAAGLSRQAAEPAGLGAVTGLLGADKGAFAQAAGSFFSAGDRSGGASSLVGSIFGSSRSAVESAISSTTDLSLSHVTRFLPMVAPVVLSAIGTARADNGLDDEAFTALLQSEADLADPAVAQALGQVSDEDRNTFTEGLTSLKAAGGLTSLIPEASSVPTAATAAVAATGTGVAVASGAASTGARSTGGSPTEIGISRDNDKGGVAWLLPALAAFLMLILGLVLWQCADNGGDVADQAPAEDVSAEPVAVAEPTAVPTAVPTPEPTPIPTAAPTAEPTAEPVALTIGEIAGGTADLSTLTGIVTDLGLAGTLSDPDAGPFTVFAPTNTAFFSAADLLGRLDEDQVASTVGFHVVPGIVTSDQVVPGAEFETLTGEILTVGADGTLPGGASVLTADIEASNGIVHIVEGVLIPRSISRSRATSDINELFALEPIQFAVSSAEILPESVATLDQAVVTLTSLPDGTLFEVQGHTDSDGGADFNQTLSESRAASVVAYLTANGVNPDMLTARGYGETALKVDPELSPADKAQNRRIEFVDIT